MNMKKVIIAAALALSATPAIAQGFTYYLVEQWVSNGMHFCRYSNGAVIAAGYSICPLSIRGL
jgi:hypothetical protein